MLIYSLPDDLNFTKRYYPGWGILMETLTENRLKASDLRDVLGLTYRQINDWDNRGILQTYRSKSNDNKDTGWRKFSVSDLMPLSILVNLKKLGIPVSRLKKVVETLFIEQYDWPGNVRQLQNVIRNIVVLHNDQVVDLTHLPAPLNSMLKASVMTKTAQQSDAIRIADIADNSFTSIKPLAEVERETIENAINFCDGNIPKAAALLDVSPSKIYRKKQGWE